MKNKKHSPTPPETPANTRYNSARLRAMTPIELVDIFRQAERLEKVLFKPGPAGAWAMALQNKQDAEAEIRRRAKEKGQRKPAAPRAAMNQIQISFNQ